MESQVAYEKFACEGAYVKNEDVRFVKPGVPRDLYFVETRIGSILQQRRENTMSPSQLQMLSDLVGVPIIELSAEKIAEIMASPQAQLRTAKYKKAVYLVEDLVFKGPYKSHDQALIKNLRFNYAIELLETALQLHERERGSSAVGILGKRRR